MTRPSTISDALRTKHAKPTVSRTAWIFIALAWLTLLLFVVDLTVGAVRIPFRDVWAALFKANAAADGGAVAGAADGLTAEGAVSAGTVLIVRRIRLIKAAVALLAGAALSVSGLQMQTLFRNPLAGPYVLGVSAGASLGVALFILGAPVLGMAGHAAIAALGLAGSAWIGAALLLALVALVSRRIKDIMVILILGMMLSSGISAVVQILQYLSHENALKSFVIWTMGSLGDVTTTQLWLLIPAVLIGLALAVAAIKPLNLLLLGENYAKTMGLNVGRSRRLIFLSTVFLAGTVTAFCGPIGFIGLAVPHVARMLLRNADHRILIPGSALCGAAVLLLCDIISKGLTLPINSITAILGIPMVIWVVVRHKNIV